MYTMFKINEIHRVQLYGFISTRDENDKNYINKNPQTDFESGEIRAIIDTFSYE